MKCAACTVDSTLPANSVTDVTEVQRTTQGQGDMHQIVHAAVLESASESSAEPPTKTTRKEKEAEAREATNVSVGLLHQLIEELENKTVPASSKEILLDSTASKERFLVWEEKEEQLVRTMEVEDNVDDEHEIREAKIPTRDHESASNRFVVKVDRESQEGLESRSSQQVIAVLGEVDLEEIHIEERDLNPTTSLPLKPPVSRDDVSMEQILPIDSKKKRKSSGDATKTKKKGLGSRLRRLFRIAFGRRDN